MSVTPHVGVWIETSCFAAYPMQTMSLPMWECGLKPLAAYSYAAGEPVTPHVGVWIETQG